MDICGRHGLENGRHSHLLQPIGIRNDGNHVGFPGVCCVFVCFFILKLNDEATKLTAFGETVLDPLWSTSGVIPRILDYLIYVHQKVVPFSEGCTNLIK